MVMCGGRNWTSVASLAFAILLFCAGFALAGDDPCERLPTANPSELLALPGADFFLDWRPPGVSCTQEGADGKPQACTSQSTITQDRMIGDHRLIVASSSPPGAPPGSNPTDYVFIFTCIDGRITAVTRGAAFNPAEKQDYSELASSEKPGAPGYGLPEFRPRYQCPAIVITEPWGGVMSFVPYHCTPPKVSISCGDLTTASADQLLTIRMPGWHGEGCYTESSPEACDWHAILRDDRTMAGARRLIDVKVTDRRYGRHWCSAQVYVFGCVDGEASTVFEFKFSDLKKIEEGADKLTMVLWSRDLQDVISRSPSISWETRLTYSWSADLQSYVLKDMHYGPPPTGDGLPRIEPSCSESSAGGTGAANPR